ncbi:MAG TPA: hypothetical protein VNL17_17055 [Verrucomicrobiae bacterium]|nr:hypothetical protein [Verrucomicrobiae bacterium]
MQKKIVAVCAVLALIAIIFWVGSYYGADSRSKLQTKRDLDLHKKLVELDRSFLTNVVTRPNTMTSGSYVLEIQFTGKPEKTAALELEFSNGQLIKMSKLPIQDLVQTGSVVSWMQYDEDEGPSARFIGLIDGNGMWGRVYVEPGQGWREGDPPAYGVWKLHPESGK